MISYDIHLWCPVVGIDWAQVFDSVAHQSIPINPTQGFCKKPQIL